MNNYLILFSDWWYVVAAIVGLFAVGGIAAWVVSMFDPKGKNEYAGCLFPIIFGLLVALIVGIVNCEGCSNPTNSSEDYDYWEDFQPKHGDNL